MKALFKQGVVDGLAPGLNSIRPGSISEPPTGLIKKTSTTSNGHLGSHAPLRHSTKLDAHDIPARLVAILALSVFGTGASNPGAICFATHMCLRTVITHTRAHNTGAPPKMHTGTSFAPSRSCIAQAVRREIVNERHIDHQVALPGEVDVSDLHVPLF